MAVAVLIDPPRPGISLPGLERGTPLDASERVDLYTAAATDLLVAVAESDAELLVSYRPDELLPPAALREQSAESAVRDVIRDAVGEGEGEPVPLDVQVGSSRGKRAANAAVELFDREDVSNVLIARASAPLLSASRVDAAVEMLDDSPVVLGPAGDGRVYLAAFAEPIDFAGAYEPPEIGTLTARAVDADLDVGFAETLPTLASPSGLAGVVGQVRARRHAGLPYPERTAEVVDDLGLEVVEDDDGQRLVRGDG